MIRMLLTTYLLFSIGTAMSQQYVFIPSIERFLSGEWTHVNNGRGVDSICHHGDEPAFCMSRTMADADSANVAYLNNFSFKNGIIECDMLSPVPKGEPSFLGIIFRAKDDTQYECVYFRPFVSGQVGAIQYMPVVSDGIVNWWDYAIEAYKAKTILPEQDWFHVKLEVMGASLKVYAGDTKEPQMSIPTLGLGTKEGTVGFWLGNSRSAYFKNLTITHIELQK